MMTVTAQKSELDLKAEEREEAERHDLLYRDWDSDRLRMKPSDWNRFDSMTVPPHAYAGSMLRLGNVEGLRVLDAGCGDGWLSVILAKRGAIVDGFDISPEGIKTAKRRAALNAVDDRCRLQTGSFYDIPADDQAFDCVIGQAILHHLRDKERAATELFRVMRPGARAIFAEPFGNSLTLERLRRFIPVPSEAPEDPTEWSRQFKYDDLVPFSERFELEVEEFHFFSRLDRLLKSQQAPEALWKFDRWLLRAVPLLRRYARTIVVEMRKPSSAR